MGVPAGWYDDGAGRQRWWDGVQWTEDYAPAGTGIADVASDRSAPTVPAPRRAPVLGFIALGLAVVGLILGCVPVVPVIVIGMVLLFAALVVGIIALFVKHTAKWPAIVSIVVSVIGGVIAAVVLLVVAVFSIAQGPVDSGPVSSPAPSISAPSEQPTDAPESSDRPTPAEISEGYLAIMHADGVHDYDDPEIAECIGQKMYDSDVSDETLWAGIKDEYPGADEFEHARDVLTDVLLFCKP
ncbi:DUF2510 domain-containing protein [Microbacterium esteraromaticum]|uniref:DUF2510 domain-containing protein n=1 Tax=Microbacterium esteraromaticum TaxID=57043 RepID=UPI000B34FE0F|nr:DUF2510 domain-containing protein [Microbacterium esteraromaticum]